MLVFDHCKECKFFIQYYVRTGFHFRPVTGRCACKARPAHAGEPLKICDYWEPTENTPSQIKKNVAQTIYEINDKLSEILEVLNLYKE